LKLLIDPATFNPSAIDVLINQFYDGYSQTVFRKGSNNKFVLDWTMLDKTKLLTDQVNNADIFISDHVIGPTAFGTNGYCTENSPCAEICSRPIPPRWCQYAQGKDTTDKFVLNPFKNNSYVYGIPIGWDYMNVYVTKDSGINPDEFTTKQALNDLVTKLGETNVYRDVFGDPNPQPLKPLSVNFIRMSSLKVSGWNDTVVPLNLEESQFPIVVHGAFLNPNSKNFEQALNFMSYLADEGQSAISLEARLIPTYRETLETYSSNDHNAYLKIAESSVLIKNYADLKTFWNP
jgi:hypothetical protein